MFVVALVRSPSKRFFFHEQRKWLDEQRRLSKKSFLLSQEIFAIIGNLRRKRKVEGWMADEIWGWSWTSSCVWRSKDFTSVRFTSSTMVRFESLLTVDFMKRTLKFSASRVSLTFDEIPASERWKLSANDSHFSFN